MYKNNSRYSWLFKSCSPLQLSCNLKAKCHAAGYYSYTNCWHQLQKMRPDIKEHDGLIIQLLSYNKPTRETEEFYFLEMSTLQATTLINKTRKLVDIKVTAYTRQDKYLDELTINSFKTINDFNLFFTQNPDFYIHNCDLELEGHLIISSHDDGEVSIKYKNSDFELIQRIFNKYRLDINLISELKQNIGHYIKIDKNSKIKGNYQTFDEYVEKTRKK